MASRGLLDLYHKFAPRWFKVIRWRDFAVRTIEMQKTTWPMFWIPGFFFVTHMFNQYPNMLCIYQPQTEEERMALKRDYVVVSNRQRDWEMGQYNHEVPPVIDVWRRRQKYPEHYGDKYNRFHGDGTWDFDRWF